MPTYEYKCMNCGFVFEKFQQMGDEPLSVCPKCKGELKRIIYGGVGIHFKGNGFYITDYSNKNTFSSNSEKSSKR